MSANAIQISLQAAGLGIRRSTILDMVRRVRKVETVGAQLQFIRLGLIPDPRRIPEALTKLRRSFSFRVRIRGTDIATGNPFKRFINVALNQPTSRQNIEMMALNFTFSEPERYQMAVDDVLLVSGVKAGEFGTLL